MFKFLAPKRGRTHTSALPGPPRRTLGVHVKTRAVYNAARCPHVRIAMRWFVFVYPTLADESECQCVSHVIHLKI